MSEEEYSPPKLPRLDDLFSDILPPVREFRNFGISLSLDFSTSTTSYFSSVVLLNSFKMYLRSENGVRSWQY